MPKFTISKNNRTLDTFQADGERIELGSANTCKLFIDDLLVSLHQAAFLKTKSGYDIEPIARTPAFTMNGQKVDQRMPVTPDAVIEIEGYVVKVDLGTGSQASDSFAPPLPEPLDLPDLPPLPPLDLPETKASSAPAPPPPSPPREKSLPPLPPPLPPIPEPVFAEAAPPPPRPLPPKQRSEPPSLPPLPPLEPPPPMPKEASRGEAPTRYVIPIKPIGQLVVIAGPLQGKKWPLSGSELKIGREEGQNDILVRFDTQGEIDTSISRRHASVHIEGDYAYVEDKGSVAGTFVSGRQVASGERVPLRSGDEIEIRSAKVSTVFRVELGTVQPQAAPVSRPAPSPPPPREPRYEAPPPVAPLQPRYEQTPQSHHDARPKDLDEPREREPIRRKERRPQLDEDNPFAPVAQQGMPQWVWLAIGGGVIVIILILVFVFI